jgi:hypothetical protein
VLFPYSTHSYGTGLRLKVRASRKRPYVVRIRMEHQPKAGSEDTAVANQQEACARKGNADLFNQSTLRQAVAGPKGAAVTEEGEDMTTPPPKVQIPADAVLTAGNDILQPLNDLLGAQGLNLKGDPDAASQAGSPAAVFGGPPQSVALIEAGATAVSKWWATGLGATVAGAWAAVSGWWSGQEPASQRVALWVAAIVTAAAVLGIAYLLGSDVRGRSTASVATIRARAQVADSMVRASQAAFIPSPAPPSAELVALPAPLPVSYSLKSSADEPGWNAVALLSNGDNITKYLIVKGAEHEWVDATSVMLVSPT